MKKICLLYTSSTTKRRLRAVWKQERWPLRAMASTSTRCLPNRCRRCWITTAWASQRSSRGVRKACRRGLNGLKAISYTHLGGRRISGNRNFTLCRLYSKIQFANLGGSRRLERSGDRARRPPLALSLIHI